MIMFKNERKSINPFFIRKGERVMVSLGPFSTKQHCPYRCAFCYVQDDFSSYESLNIDNIIKYLKSNIDNYNIIYVSGDTDSFAPPRTKLGLKLLSNIVDVVKCDLLFTSRYVFNNSEYEQLARIITKQNSKGFKFYAGVSITRYSEKNAYLEPFPIPKPDDRISHIKKMKSLGAITMLGLRPFLPVVEVNEYLTILDEAYPSLDIALGESFYFIRNGNVQKRVFPNGIPIEFENNISRNQRMDFDDNESLWDIWDSKVYEEIVENHCDKLNIVFSMHSNDAIDKYEKKCLRI
jgi:DNA repair photolyase